ncbi:hypothetical protein PMIN04_010330 [Paraphaeosphaeria minitans]
MEVISKSGRTSVVYRYASGLVAKMPREMSAGLPGRKEWDAEIDNAFMVEQKLLRRLGLHPRIVVYQGPCHIKGMKEGLLLGEANCGELQSYIDKFNCTIDNALREQWSLQVAQAVEYVHGKGIIHSNLSTTNVLVHRAGTVPELLLADFGGSRCEALDVFGELLPDDPFSDPWLTDSQFKLPKLDLYSLGVVIYIIMTGHQPFHDGPAPQGEERLDYMDRVRELYERGQFPDLTDVPFAGIIQGCCVERRFNTAKDVVLAIELEMGQVA